MFWCGVSYPPKDRGEENRTKQTLNPINIYYIGWTILVFDQLSYFLTLFKLEYIYEIPKQLHWRNFGRENNQVTKSPSRMFLREGGERGFTMKDQAFTEETEQNNNALEENNKKSK